MRNECLAKLRLHLETSSESPSRLAARAGVGHMTVYRLLGGKDCRTRTWDLIEQAIDDHVITESDNPSGPCLSSTSQTQSAGCEGPEGKKTWRTFWRKA